MSKGVITITDDNFETEVLKAEKPVLVYFWAEWCGPCKLMSPMLNLAASKYGDSLKIVKMEVDPNPKTVEQYKVEGLPALRLIKENQILASAEGIPPKKDDFLELLDKHLNGN